MLLLLLSLDQDMFITNQTYKNQFPIWVCLQRTVGVYQPQELMQNLVFSINNQIIPQNQQVILDGSQNDFNQKINQVETCNKIKGTYQLYILQSRNNACVITCEFNEIPRVLQYQINIAGSYQNSIFIIFKQVLLDRTGAKRYPKIFDLTIQQAYFSPKISIFLQIIDVFNSSIVVKQAEVEIIDSQNQLRLIQLQPISPLSNQLQGYISIPKCGVTLTQLSVSSEMLTFNQKILAQYIIIWPILVAFFCLFIFYALIYLYKSKIIKNMPIHVQQFLLKYIFFNKLEAALFQAKEHYNEVRIVTYQQDHIQGSNFALQNDVEEAETSIIIQQNFYEDDKNKLLSYLFPQINIDQSEESSEIIKIKPIFLLEQSLDNETAVSINFHVVNNQTQSEFTFVEDESAIFDNLQSFQDFQTDDESDSNYNIFKDQSQNSSSEDLMDLSLPSQKSTNSIINYPQNPPKLQLSIPDFNLPLQLSNYVSSTEIFPKTLPMLNFENSEPSNSRISAQEEFSSLTDSDCPSEKLTARFIPQEQPITARHIPQDPYEELPASARYMPILSLPSAKFTPAQPFQTASRLKANLHVEIDDSDSEISEEITKINTPKVPIMFQKFQQEQAEKLRKQQTVNLASKAVKSQNQNERTTLKKLNIKLQQSSSSE